MASKTSASGNRLIANNKKAYFDYFIEEKYEAGMVLHGTEVKSIRAGKCSIKESYIKIENGEVYVLGMNITPYEKGNIFNKDPLRPKKLLLHKNQINKLTGELTIKGYTLVPLQVYLKEGKVKMEIGLGKGKKNFDKRDSIAKKDQIRDAQKEFKAANRRFKALVRETAQAQKKQVGQKLEDSKRLEEAREALRAAKSKLHAMQQKFSRHEDEV